MTGIKIYSGVNTAINWPSFCQLARLFSDVSSAVSFFWEFRNDQVDWSNTHPKAKSRLLSCEIITKKKKTGSTHRAGARPCFVHHRYISFVVSISIQKLLCNFFPFKENMYINGRKIVSVENKKKERKEKKKNKREEKEKKRDRKMGRESVSLGGDTSSGLPSLVGNLSGGRFSATTISGIPVGTGGQADLSSGVALLTSLSVRLTTAKRNSLGNLPNASSKSYWMFKKAWVKLGGARD
ncbi:uncharacterized protein LOC117601919 isoform X2 [Osmia lignaria lignaria]|uniref:uncharacterized protein LOC117601919 isoform X2 n=1 Tax=Osmia lignaria lignaria TaxID=1437193 RepID=UPI00402B4A83